MLRWSHEHLDAPSSATILTGRNAEQDTVQALNSDADGYVSELFRPNELKVRTAAMPRCHGGTRPAQHEVQTFSDLSFDDAELTMTWAGAPISLTEREYRLARCLFANLGWPLSRGYLYEHLQSRGGVLSSRPLDTYIYRPRDKLSLTAECGRQLLTIHGYGYRSEGMATVD